MSPSPFKFNSAEECPDAGKHHDRAPNWPTSYVGRAMKAEAMSKTHRQTRCKTCGFWTQWVPKRGSRIK